MSISVADAASVDRAKLVEILSGEHVQAAAPEVVEREIIERTVASNLEFANELGRALNLPARDYVGTEPDTGDADVRD